MFNSIHLSTTEKISLMSNLATMLSAGIPILEAITSLLEDSKGNQKKILSSLREDLVQGERIHASFRKFPQVFSPVTVSLIKAAEEAGTLTTTLKDLKDSLRKEAEFMDKIKGAFLYPMIISLVFAGVLLMILVVVVPKISLVFSRLSVELPLPTQILIGLSNLLLQHTLPLIISCVAVVFLVTLIFKRNKDLILAPFYSLPLISQLVREIDLTRFSHNFHLLLNAGLPITSALELTQAVVVKKETKKLIKNTLEMVKSGKAISEGFRSVKNSLPVIVLKLIEVGDKTGTLDKSMQEISEYLDYKVTNTLKTLTVVIEPLLLVVVGACVGAMMLAIIAPIYGLIGQVGGR